MEGQRGVGITEKEIKRRSQGRSGKKNKGGERDR